MERRLGLKNAHQQIVCEQRIERKARFNVVAQADLPFDHDDGADALRRELRRGHRQLFDRLLGALRGEKIAEERRPAQVSKSAADVRLEQHDDGKHDVPERVANEPVDRLEMAPP